MNYHDLTIIKTRKTDSICPLNCYKNIKMRHPCTIFRLFLVRRTKNRRGYHRINHRINHRTPHSPSHQTATYRIKMHCSERLPLCIIEKFDGRTTLFPFFIYVTFTHTLFIEPGTCTKPCCLTATPGPITQQPIPDNHTQQGKYHADYSQKQ